MKKRAYFFIYIIKVKNGYFYTGYTTDLQRRVQEHLQGTPKSKYTQAFKAVALEQAWKLKGSRGEAMRVEAFIKQLSRDEKKELIATPGVLAKKFSYKKGLRLKLQPIK